MKKTKMNSTSQKSFLLITFVLGLLFVCITLFSAPFSKVAFAATSSPVENYLTFSSENGFTIEAEKNWNGTIQYSTDSENWINYLGGTELSASQSGSTGEFFIYFQGSGNTRISSDSLGNSSSWIINGTNVSCSGNIEKLLDSTDTHTQMDKYCFKGMFKNCTALINAPSFSATSLTTSCYESMFEGCSALTEAPTLPATTLSDYCYRNMFSGCTSLTKASELPERALADGCYYQMFSDCTALKKAPTLPATSLTMSCYEGMFENCSALTEAPNLLATALKDNCYKMMFSGCTNIKLSTEDNDGKHWNIPTSDTYPTDWNTDMFANRTDGFPTSPSAGTYYYTNIYYIKYNNAFNGVNDVVNPNPTTYNIDEEISEIILQNPTRTGYTFLGWKNGQISGNDYITSISIATTGTKILNAEWKLNEYDLYLELSHLYNQTSANKDVLTSALKHGQTFQIYIRSKNPYYATLPDAITLTREGHTLYEGTDYTYVITESDAGLISIFASTVTGPITISANGILQSFNILYDVNGGDEIDDLQLLGKETINYEKEDFAMPIPSRPGYNFVGWFYKYDDSVDLTYLGQDYIDYCTIPNSDEPYLGTDLSNESFISSNAFKLVNCKHLLGIRAFQDSINHTFVAKWKLVQQSIAYINATDGLENVVNSNPLVYNFEDETITLSDPTKEGYTFIGWTTPEISTPTKNLTIEQASIGDMVFVANWTKNSASLLWLWILLGCFGFGLIVIFLWLFGFKRTIKFFINGNKVSVAKYKRGEELKFPINLARYKWFTDKEQTKILTKQKMGMIGFSVYGTIKKEINSPKKLKTDTK